MFLCDFFLCEISVRVFLCKIIVCVRLQSNLGFKQQKPRPMCTRSGVVFCCLKSRFGCIVRVFLCGIIVCVRLLFGCFCVRLLFVCFCVGLSFV